MSSTGNLGRTDCTGPGPARSHLPNTARDGAADLALVTSKINNSRPATLQQSNSATPLFLQKGRRICHGQEAEQVKSSESRMRHRLGQGLVATVHSLQGSWPLRWPSDPLSGSLTTSRVHSSSHGVHCPTHAPSPSGNTISMDTRMSSATSIHSQKRKLQNSTRGLLVSSFDTGKQQLRFPAGRGNESTVYSQNHLTPPSPMNPLPITTSNNQLPITTDSALCYKFPFPETIREGTINNYKYSNSSV